MNTFIRVIGMLKYLAPMGFLYTYFGWDFFRWFFFFGFLALVEIALTFPFFCKSLALSFGSSYAWYKYKKNIPSKENYKSLIQYALPFRGEWAVINGGLDRETSHSWKLSSQRYAYDFLILDENNKTHRGDSKFLNNYYCYGKEVLATADGIVVEVKERFKDCKIIGNGQMDQTTPDITGNRVVIKHAEHEYSMVAHLMPRSVTVKVGQSVKQGDVIGLCGNSGNTTEPHIHFQLQNTRSFYTSVGLPVYFKSIIKNTIKNYHKLDLRPIPNFENLEYDVIARGLNVKNITF